MVGTAVPTATVENRLGRTRQTLSLLPQMRDARSKVGHLTNGSSAHTPPRLGPENTSFQMFGWEERSILLQNLLYAALVFSSGGTFWAAPGPGQPWKHNFCLAESWGWAWWSTSSSGNPQAAAARQHNLCAAKKPLFTTLPNIINQPTVCSDRKLLLTTLILLNKWNHPITHSNLINRSTQRRKWALQNGLEKSSHFVLPFN